MSYYNFGLNNGRQYSASVYAGEGFGSSMMTNHLHQMINQTLNTYIQRAITQVVAQLLMSILQPILNNNQGQTPINTVLPDLTDER